jgi:DNA-binding transcriptional ArsR family regulator
VHDESPLTALTKAATDPLAIAIVTSLTLEPASAAELAVQLGAPIEQVRYQIKWLREAGLVSVHERRERRGALEHTYIADSRKMGFSTEDALAFPAERLRRCQFAMLRLIFKEALEAIRTGALSNPDDYLILRVPLRLDRDGFKEIVAISDAALERLFTIREESLARLRGGDEESTLTNSVLLFFEVPG